MGGQSEVRAVAAAAAAASVDFLLLLSLPSLVVQGGTLLVGGKEGSGRTEENCIRSHTAHRTRKEALGSFLFSPA